MLFNNIVDGASGEHNISVSELNIGGPTPRVGHATVIYDEEFYVFGGYDNVTNTYLNDLWKAVVVGPKITWVKLFGKSPLPARAFHSGIVYQDSIYYFGGSTTDGHLLNDVWRYDIRLGYWIRCFVNGATPNPPARESHGSAYYGDEGMYIWGGIGEYGYLDDMWKFDLQNERWEKVYQGLTFPSARGHFASVVIDEQWVFLGGQVGNERLPTKFWSPDTRFIPLYNPDEFSGEVWKFDFNTRLWEYIGCMPVFSVNFGGNSDLTPEQCRSHNKPSCLNDCSGNGVCVAEDQCVCRGQWEGKDCSWNVCENDKHRGYTTQLIDRVLITESVLKLGKELAFLKNKLQYIKERLPSYEEYVSCVHAGEQDIGQIYVISASVEGVRYHTKCMTEGLLPIFEEFNDCLDKTSDNEPFYTPLAGYLGNI